MAGIVPLLDRCHEPTHPRSSKKRGKTAEGSGVASRARWVILESLRLSMNLGNTEHPTSNIQHPTANQWPNWKPLVVRCWMLGVGCFPSVHGFNARIFRGILTPILSPSEGERENHLETDGVADGLRSGLVLVFAVASA